MSSLEQLDTQPCKDPLSISSSRRCTIPLFPNRQPPNPLSLHHHHSSDSSETSVSFIINGRHMKKVRKAPPRASLKTDLKSCTLKRNSNVRKREPVRGAAWARL